MLHTAKGYNGMVVTPHHLASQAGLEVLRQNGTAAEAVIAAAAVLCVVYPHMTGLGGDAFWLIHDPLLGQEPVYIDACGRSSRYASIEKFRQNGHMAIPRRGPLAAVTVAGAVSGWEAALAVSARKKKNLPLPKILSRAIEYAENGFPVSCSLSSTIREHHRVLSAQPGFADTFMPNGRCPYEGDRLRLPALAGTLKRLYQNGLNGFYRGELAKDIAGELAKYGALLGLDDLKAHTAETAAPLSTSLSGNIRLFNSPPPTQGAASLIILGIFDRVRRRDNIDPHDETALVHALVESTKQAFILRDRHIGDPACMSRPAADLLRPEMLDDLAGQVKLESALPWPCANPGGDTVWLGAMDSSGMSVSCIQSLYFEFGSGLTLPQTGITWQNRGVSFSLCSKDVNGLAPAKKPFHTLNPAMAIFDNGSVMAYGTMGGEGQPQTQAAIFARHVFQKRGLQEAVTAPRWLLGRSWGDPSVSLKLEGRFPAKTITALRKLGHDIEMLPDFSPLMGHAGMLLRSTDGLLSGAADPRGDGAAACW